VFITVGGDLTVFPSANVPQRFLDYEKLLNFQLLHVAWFPLRNRISWHFIRCYPRWIALPALNMSILPYGNGEFKEESQTP